MYYFYTIKSNLQCFLETLDLGEYCLKAEQSQAKQDQSDESARRWRTASSAEKRRSTFGAA